MTALNLRIKLGFCLFLFLFFDGFANAQPATNQICWRKVQLQNEQEHSAVRVYLDKYGYFYPATSVPIDEQQLLNPYPGASALDTASGNLYAFFKRHPANARQLFTAYGITPTQSFNADYYNTQEAYLCRVATAVHAQVAAKGAKTIVFLIHGFNETDPTAAFQYFEKAVTAGGYDTSAKPVYIEMFWDGLSTYDNIFKFPAVWKHAQGNTRYVSLSVRDLMWHITDRLNFVVVSHSLGGSIATGALFNCTSKWKRSRDTTIDHELAGLMKTIPSSTDVHLRLGMIVPAIPGAATFADFNHRSPDISTPNNHIDKVVIGFNPKDYATRKYVLSATEGATTLGCNWHNEIDKVKNTLSGLGYPGSLISKVQFTTPPKYGLQDHDFKAYMNDAPDFKQFLDQLFRP
jgi:hypothetical protein